MRRGDKVKVKATGWIGEVASTDGYGYVKVSFDEEKEKLSSGDWGTWRKQDLELVEGE